MRDAQKEIILILILSSCPVYFSWTAAPKTTFFSRDHTSSSLLRSTPFEADLYDDNPYDDSSPLAVPPDTKLVLGLTKYSHDTTLCAADARTGRVLFALSKERLTRRKHDAGNVAVLVDACLEQLDLQLDNVERVVMNNHHHRIRPLEENLAHMEWEMGLRINGGVEGEGYDEPENRFLTNATELSHHLAHVYSTATQAPFERGLCVVMDGMGETYRTMLQAHEEEDRNYVSDLSLSGGLENIPCVIPSDIHDQSIRYPFDFREAESVYVFEKTETSVDIRPIFKRFTRENSPPTLYNHGFENMDSVGAVYSRVSSHIFADWNACGKVMGLAPWAVHEWTNDKGDRIAPKLHDQSILSGSLFSEDDPLVINRTLIEGLPFSARNDPDMFNPTDGTQKKKYDFDADDTTKDDSKRLPLNVALDAIALADRMQSDLEVVVKNFVHHFQRETGEENLCLAGGVALNSVLNGKLARELGFKRTFISPYPGDDGVAVGCCAFGLFGSPRLSADRSSSTVPLPVWKEPITPYLGPTPKESEIKEAIENALPWISVELVANEDLRLRMMAEEVESGGVIAWFRSRSEMGPRALGHRSILADPRKKPLVRFINEHVKSRESFRPFAPSVLAEEAADWFDLGDHLAGGTNVSPFMSMTAMVHEEKRSLIPAVTHVDGSSRLQTVSREDEPLYYKFLKTFFRLTSVPMVLNTSFNTIPSEPIVETPNDAIRSFLYSMGSLEMLVLDDYVIKRKKADLRKLLGEATRDGDVKVDPGLLVRAGPATFRTTFELPDEPTEEESVQSTTMVRMPDRLTHHDTKNEWFQLLDDFEAELLTACDGTVTLNDIVTQYTAVEAETKMEEKELKDAQNLLQNIVQRLVRLYEHTFISW